MGYLDDHPLLNIIFHSKSPPRTFWQKLWSFITFRGFIYILLLLSSNVLALDIELANRVQNRKPGYCAWASIEMVGRQRGIKELFNLVENRTKDPDEILINAFGKRLIFPKNGGPGFALEKKLTSLGVKYRYQHDGNFDKSILHSANKNGCIFGIKPYQLKYPAGPQQYDFHALLLTKYPENDDEDIEFYDSNFISTMFVGKVSWLNQAWTGMALVIE